jgi:hypothetical protein
MKNFRRAAFVPPATQTLGAALLTAAMTLPLANIAHADSAPERGSVSLKSLNYEDRQPDSERIHVRANALRVEAPIAGEWLVGGTYTADSVSGASPAYQTTSLTKMHDYRRAADADVTRYFADGTLTLGASVSSESDYLSRNLSIQGTRSSEDKNTTWTAGIGVTSDAINPTNRVVEHETKHINNLLLGVTQVLTTKDIVQLNVGGSWGRGYFSDPYKLFDNRPRERNNNTVMARWNHHLDSTQGTLRFSYRYYYDTWRIKAHTLGAEYVQPLPDGWTVTPLIRLYSQSAASFYIDANQENGPFGPTLPDGTIHYSEDQRLSAFGARTVGLKVAKRIGPDWLIDLKYEQYEQRGAWRFFGDGSPGLAPFSARIIQVGLTWLF